jgi:sugar lactone lactonase YvrE
MAGASVRTVSSLAGAIATCGVMFAQAPSPTPTPTPTYVPYTVITLAGIPNGGYLDATGTAAKFESPYGVALDSNGNLYVCDTSNFVIRMITPGGVVSTFAGNPGVPGSLDGTGSSALFEGPVAITIDSADNLYVSDVGTIRKITLAGVVTTLAGSSSSLGYTDGTGAAAQFSSYITGLSVDSTGDIYAADFLNSTIRVITQAGVVTTLPAVDGLYTPGNSGVNITGVVVDGLGNTYFSVQTAIKKIDSVGAISVVAGIEGQPGRVDGTGASAKFGSAQALSIDGNGNMFVSDGNLVREITPGGVVTTLAGNSYNFEIRKIDSGGVVTTFAGAGPTTGDINGPAATATFAGPSAVALDNGGDVYVLDPGNQVVRLIAPGGAVTNYASTTGSYMAGDTNGNLYVTNQQDISKIAPGGIVTEFAGSSSAQGNVNGPPSTARFGGFFNAIATDLSGNVYVSDYINHAIRKIDRNGNVSTLIGIAPNSTTVGTGAFLPVDQHYEFGMTADGIGNVYVLASGGAVTAVYKIDQAGNSSMITPVSFDSDSDFYPGIASDPAGNIFRFFTFCCG